LADLISKLSCVEPPRRFDDKITVLLGNADTWNQMKHVIKQYEINRIITPGEIMFVRGRFSSGEAVILRF
jgi:hypothetical protein